MQFRISDTFTDSLAKLTGNEQKAVKTTAFDLQLNPANPGMQFHKLNAARDPNFWSIRVNRDIRLIVHRTAESLLLCYVDHHDKAYRWAERRKLETHPKTGAAQLVEIRETVKEVVVPAYVEQPQVAEPKPALFVNFGEDELLGYGVPPEWLEDVRVANEENILELVEHLPGEAAEALLELATGGRPEIVQRAAVSAAPFEHPDAQRRFRVVENVEELELALEYPWEKWSVFLHPAQRDVVEKDFSGPARVSGSAGTGKTIVALHRAVFLAREDPDARVLLTTFSQPLADSLKIKLRRLIGNQPRIAERLEVESIEAIAKRLYAAQHGQPKISSTDTVKGILRNVVQEEGVPPFSLAFLLAEWGDVIDAWQLESWEAYRDVKRLGRRTRLPESQRAQVWGILQRLRETLTERGLLTLSDLYGAVESDLNARERPPFDFTVVDEAQDVSVAQLKFLAALAGDRPNALFFAGDLGQRIFQTPFSWKALGVDVRGRSRTLRVNYRTSHQIRSQADRLLGPEVSDVDGNIEKRRGTVSVFNGPPPVVHIHDDQDAEVETVSTWLKDLSKHGIAAHEVGIFVRSVSELERVERAVEEAGFNCKILDAHVRTAPDHVSVSTMHLAKGLEFRGVAVMCCDDEVLPLQERIETVTDESDLQEVYDTERHLLYVACTRARDHLMVSGVDPASEFLDDLTGR